MSEHLAWWIMAVLVFGPSAPAAVGAEPALTKPTDLAPNTWVKVHVSPDSGQRNSPIFFYEPNLKKFILSGGVVGFAPALRSGQ